MANRHSSDLGGLPEDVQYDQTPLSGAQYHQQLSSVAAPGKKLLSPTTMDTKNAISELTKAKENNNVGMISVHGWMHAQAGQSQV